ncbi:hypothetical protein LTR17_024147 [Elasticomyces elasticus]|nr:hypothetical protein LTR17_024147 [Elasticomyces elasticus]
MPMVTRTFSLTNFVIATSALGFQIFVLYPWHKELDEGFTKLRSEHVRILQEGQDQRQQDLMAIRKELEMIRMESRKR